MVVRASPRGGRESQVARACAVDAGAGRRGVACPSRTRAAGRRERSGCATTSCRVEPAQSQKNAVPRPRTSTLAEHAGYGPSRGCRCTHGATNSYQSRPNPREISSASRRMRSHRSLVPVGRTPGGDRARRPTSSRLTPVGPGRSRGTSGCPTSSQGGAPRTWLFREAAPLDRHTRAGGSSAWGAASAPSSPERGRLVGRGVRCGHRVEQLEGAGERGAGTLRVALDHRHFGVALSSEGGGRDVDLDAGYSPQAACLHRGRSARAAAAGVEDAAARVEVALR